MSTWCDVCEKDSHNTADCWGSGTVVVGQKPGFKSSPTIPREAPGFHKKNIFSSLRCRHSEHNAPTHLHVPADKRFVHYCPQCGQKDVIEGVDWTLQTR